MSGGGGGGGEYDVQLNLVPLIDILTNILFFLMVGFAAQESAMEVNNIKLPVATTDNEMKKSIAISVSKSEVAVDDIKVAGVDGDKIDAARNGDDIVPLYEKLNTLRAARQSASGGVSENDDVVLMVADRGVPFSVLSPVMKTAARAGFPNFRFVVVKK